MGADNTYSDRELDAKFAAIDEKLDLILHQTTKTNGRVTSLEKTRIVVITSMVVLASIAYPQIGKILAAVAGIL